MNNQYQQFTLQADSGQRLVTWLDASKVEVGTRLTLADHTDPSTVWTVIDGGARRPKKWVDERRKLFLRDWRKHTDV